MSGARLAISVQSGRKSQHMNTEADVKSRIHQHKMIDGSILNPFQEEEVPGVAPSRRFTVGSRMSPSAQLAMRLETQPRKHSEETPIDFYEEYRRRDLQRARHVHKEVDDIERYLREEAPLFPVYLNQSSLNLIEPEPAYVIDSPLLSQSEVSNSRPNNGGVDGMETVHPHKSNEYFCHVEGCPRSKRPTNNDKGRSFGPREDMLRVHIRTMHEKKATRNPSSNYLPLSSSKTLSQRQGRTPRGRKRRIIVACTNCRRRLEVCISGTPCRSCLEHGLDTSCIRIRHSQHNKQPLAQSPHRQADSLQGVRTALQDEDAASASQLEQLRLMDECEQRIKNGHNEDLPDSHAHRPNSASRKRRLKYTISVDDTKHEGARSRMHFMALGCEVSHRYRKSSVRN